LSFPSHLSEIDPRNGSTVWNYDHKEKVRSKILVSRNTAFAACVPNNVEKKIIIKGYDISKAPQIKLVLSITVENAELNSPEIAMEGVHLVFGIIRTIPQAPVSLTTSIFGEMGYVIANIATRTYTFLPLCHLGEVAYGSAFSFSVAKNYIFSVLKGVGKKRKEESLRAINYISKELWTVENSWSVTDLSFCHYDDRLIGICSSGIGNGPPSVAAFDILKKKKLYSDSLKTGNNSEFTPPPEEEHKENQTIDHTKFDFVSLVLGDPLVTSKYIYNLGIRYVPDFAVFVIYLLCIDPHTRDVLRIHRICSIDDTKYEPELNICYFLCGSKIVITIDHVVILIKSA